MIRERNPRSSSERLADPGKRLKIYGAGEMADTIRAYNWAATSLGPIETWPDTLIGSTNTILASRFPMMVIWGPAMVQLYNDPFRDLIAERHPRALAQSARECWKEAWHILGPQIEDAFHGKPVNRENVLVPITRNGKLHDVYWTYSYSPLYECSGKIKGALVVCRDVTREIQATRERDALSEQLNRVLDATTDAVLTLDRDWRFSYLNRKAREILAAGTDVLNLNIWDTFACISYPGSPFVENLRRAMDGGVAREFETYYPDPLNMWLHINVQPASDGIAIFFRDITAQKTAEITTRSNTARLDAIYNTSLEYIGLLSTDGILLDCNRASLEFAGNTREELIGLPFWDCPWFAHTPGAPEMLRRAIARAAGGEYVRLEIQLMRPVGESITFDFSLAPVRDSTGQIVFIVPEGRDITWTKRAEVALKESEKLAAVGRLAASIAHEINNPLEAVTNLLYLALSSRNIDRVHGFLRTAEEELRRVSIISSQTLRFHRQSASPITAPAAELIESTITIFQGRMLNSGIHLEQRLRAKVPIVCFDGEIRQVLNNLVSNAIDAMQARGGRIYIRSRNATHWPDGRIGLVFTIADTGAGISHENLGRIFDAFFTTKGIGGTGLGLWVSHEIVLRHQGVLRVRSSRKPRRSGTVFTLFLPLNGVAQQMAA